MAKTKPYRKVVKILKDNGWVHTRTDGSHEIYVKDGKALPCKVQQERYSIRNFNEY